MLPETGGNNDQGKAGAREITLQRRQAALAIVAHKAHHLVAEATPGRRGRA